MPHSKPALRYMSSTGWANMNPYVKPLVCENRCHKRIFSTTGSRIGAVELPLRHTFWFLNAGM